MARYNGEFKAGDTIRLRDGSTTTLVRIYQSSIQEIMAASRPDLTPTGLTLVRLEWMATDDQGRILVLDPEHHTLVNNSL